MGERFPPDEHETGYDTLEEAARGDIPERFVTIVGVRWITGDRAHVWMVTNDRPTYEGYEVDCVRKGSRWYYEGGSGGFSIYTPPDVHETAAPAVSRIQIMARSTRPTSR